MTRLPLTVPHRAITTTHTLTFSHYENLELPINDTEDHVSKTKTPTLTLGSNLYILRTHIALHILSTDLKLHHCTENTGKCYWVSGQLVSTTL